MIACTLLEMMDAVALTAWSEQYRYLGTLSAVLVQLRAAAVSLYRVLVKYKLNYSKETHLMTILWMHQVHFFVRIHKFSENTLVQSQYH